MTRSAPPPVPARGALSPRTLGLALLAGLALWQAAAAALVRIEYYDGFDTIANARYFLGETPGYVHNRAPLFAWLLVPAQWLRGVLSLPPLALAPYHATSALVHVAHLAAVYALLVRRHGHGWPVLLAFAAAVPTFTWFAYAPFISHDLAPGGLLLGMLFAADRHAAQPSRPALACLVALGTAAALIKPSYGLFWIAILAAYALLARRDPRARDGLPGLAAAATVSGALAWVAIAWALRDSFPDTALAFKPLRQLEFLASGAGGQTRAPSWIYLRNAPAHGVLACALIGPALWRARRGDRLERSAALAWIVCVIAFQSLALREVRYLAFLAPVSALLLVPVWRAVLERRWLAGVLLASLAASFAPFAPYSPAREAARIVDPFYRDSELVRFLAPLGTGAGRREPIATNGSLVFTPARESPLAGDPYHEVFHFARHHFALVLGYPFSSLIPIDRAGLDRARGWRPPSAVAWCSHPRFTNGLTNKQSLEQFLALAVAIPLAAADGGLRAPDASAVRIARAFHDGAAISVLEGPALERWVTPLAVRRADVAGEAAPRYLERVGDGRFALSGPALEEVPASISIRGLSVVRRIEHRGAGG